MARSSPLRERTAKLLAESIAGKCCPICLCEVEEQTAAVVIPCNHAYCVECIRRWSNLKRRCPICNSEFDSWFYGINSSSQTFRKEELNFQVKRKTLYSEDVFSRRRRFLTQELRRTREELRATSTRTRPVPWQRSFSWGQDEHPDVVAERVLQWRASVYEQQLQAIPFSSKNGLLQQMPTSNDAKNQVRQTIEPWIKRELQAILGDPDPGVIIHVATSLFISVHERKYEGTSAPSSEEPDFLSPLQPFLLEKTKMFWHELSCFAESPYYMQTYDRLVKYTRRLE